MRECLNCKSIVREEDTYCRNCGCLLESNKKYIVTNVIIVLIIILIIIMFILFIASYMLQK